MARGEEFCTGTNWLRNVDRFGVPSGHPEIPSKSDGSV